MSSADNKAVIEDLWQTLYTKDWEKLEGFFTEDALYEDVPTPDAGARGAANIVKRLQIGLDPVERFEHHHHRMVAEGDTLVFEHTEVWHFHTGERVQNDFVTVHEMRDGKVALWRDYWDLGTLMAQAPKWWIERLAEFSAEDFGSTE